MDTKGCTCSHSSPLLSHPSETAVWGLYGTGAHYPCLSERHTWDESVQSLTVPDASKTWALGLVTPCSWPLVCIFKMVRLSFQMLYTYLHYLQGILSVLLIISIAELSIAVTIASFRSNCWANSNEVSSVMLVSMDSYWDTSR